MSFHGNMQVAIAEARTLVESGNRVAFFASSNGEVERMADILNEYGVPTSWGWSNSTPHPPIWPSGPTWPARTPAFTW
jgi:hypothetical protein